MEPLRADSLEYKDLERNARRERDHGASREEVALALDERGTHPWNILTILHRTGFGLGESKEWMRRTGRWPGFMDVLDRTNMALMQALSSDPDAKTVVDEEGNLSFEYNLGDLGEERVGRVVDPDAPPASKWWWLAVPIVVPMMLVFLLLRLGLLLAEDVYIRITGRK